MALRFGRIEFRALELFMDKAGQGRFCEQKSWVEPVNNVNSFTNGIYSHWPTNLRNASQARTQT